ncbi:MAG: hypothetical protein J6R88_04225, partial [Clostridia bacterium]|nr:hypothetical protein [Clostridia bacterium]
MLSLLFSDSEVTFLYSIIDVISIVISIGLFILKGFAIRYIAKKNGYNNLWMAFVPFLNYILLGKYIGKCKVWGLNLKNIGLWLCIMSAVQLFGSGIINAGYYVDSFIQTLEGFGLSAKITFSSKFFEMFYYLTGGSYGQTSYLAEITNISIYTNVIFLLVDLAILIAYAFFEINFFLLLFKKLAPQYLTMFTIL